MTVQSSKAENYFAKQLRQLTQEQEIERSKIVALKAQAQDYYPPVEQASQIAQQKFKKIVYDVIEQNYNEVYATQLKPALSLKSIASGKKNLLIWAFLIFLFFIISNFLFKTLVTVSIYIFLVHRGRKLSTKKLTQEFTQFYQKFAESKISFMHFGDKESGNPDYPYPTIRAPTSQRSVSTEWRIDPKYGIFFNENFVVIHMLKDTNKEFAVIHIPKDGSECKVIPIDANAKFDAWQTYEKILKNLGNQLKEEIKTIEKFSDYSQDWVVIEHRLKLQQQRIKTLEDVQLNWSDVSLQDEILDRILKIVDMFKSGRKPIPKGVLLYGPPGTGKTLIARKLAKQVGCHFEAVNIADLKATHIGHTAPKVQALWKRCREHSPTILFVDECESAFAKRGGTDNDSFGNELIQTFISEWDGFNQAAGQVFVIGATNRRDILDSAIVSRFTASIEISLPNDKAREKILQNECKLAGLNVEISRQLISETSGMSGRDIHTLIATVAAEQYGADVNQEAILKQIYQIRGKTSTQVKSLSWSDIILPENTLSEFKNLGRELRNAEKLASLGISTPKGILLYGPPGTGKTQIARVLAGESGLAFLAASTSDLKANYIGQSGSKVKQLFEQARSQAPCILFIDEIDVVAGARGEANDSFTQEIVGQLLQEIDGVATKEGQVFLLAASNYPEQIDSALLSRLERKIEIGLPDQKARAKILHLLLSSKPIDFDLVKESQHLARLTAGYSGRDLNSLVTRATRKAVNRTMDQDDSIDNIVITCEDLDIEVAVF